MQKLEWKSSIPVAGKYDVIVAGAGVAGITAAVAARRLGKSVLILEKSMELGGLATLGQINYHVPMCNGRGKRIIKGMMDELIALSVKYGTLYNLFSLTAMFLFFLPKIPRHIQCRGILSPVYPQPSAELFLQILQIPLLIIEMGRLFQYTYLCIF